MKEKNNHPLAKWREKNGISQVQFGIQLGKAMKLLKPVAQKTIFEWENGTMPRVDVAEAIEKLTKSAVKMTVWKKYN